MVFLNNLKRFSAITKIIDGKIFISSPSRIAIFKENGKELIRFNVGEFYSYSILFSNYIIFPGIRSLVINLKTLESTFFRFRFIRPSQNYIIGAEYDSFILFDRNLTKIYNFEYKSGWFYSGLRILDDGTVICKNGRSSNLIDINQEIKFIPNIVFCYRNNLIHCLHDGVKYEDRKYPNMKIVEPISDGLFYVSVDKKFKLFDFKYRREMPEEIMKILCAPYSYTIKIKSEIICGADYIVGWRRKREIVFINREKQTFFTVGIPNIFSHSVNDRGEIFYNTESNTNIMNKVKTNLTILYWGKKLAETFPNFGFLQYFELLEKIL